jgi:DNA-directed RNA polymerase subunit RPC12/RpoP
MSIHFACGSCGKSFTVDDRFAGKTGRCKDCGSHMQIPGKSPELDFLEALPVKRESTPLRAEQPATAVRSRNTAYDDIDSPPQATQTDLYGFDDDPLPLGHLWAGRAARTTHLEVGRSANPPASSPDSPGTRQEKAGSGIS